MWNPREEAMMWKERKLTQKEKAKAKKCASELPIAFRNYCLASEDVSREVTWNYISEQFIQQDKRRRIYLLVFTPIGQSLSQGILTHMYFLHCAYMDAKWALR